MTTVETDQGAWVVPPHRAVWIRAGVDFRVRMSGVVAMRRSRLHVRAAVKGLYVVDTPITAILDADFDFGQHLR